MIIHNFAGSSSQLCSHGFHMEITAILRPLTFDSGSMPGQVQTFEDSMADPIAPPIRGFHAATHFPMIYSRRIIRV